MIYESFTQTTLQEERDPTVETSAPTDEVFRWELSQRASLVSADTKRPPAVSPGPELVQRGEGSTTPEEPSSKIREEILSLCNAAKYEHFEDGMESPFSQELVHLIRKYGKAGAAELAGLIVHRVIDDDVASEALRWIGLMEHSPSYLYRRWLLANCLFCPSPKTRDGAALGLAFLNDPYAIPYLREGLGQEDRQWLRRRMQGVLDQLEAVH